MQGASTRSGRPTINLSPSMQQSSTRTYTDYVHLQVYSLRSPKFTSVPVRERLHLRTIILFRSCSFTIIVILLLHPAIFVRCYLWSARYASVCCPVAIYLCCSTESISTQYTPMHMHSRLRPHFTSSIWIIRQLTSKKLLLTSNLLCLCTQGWPRYL